MGQWAKQLISFPYQEVGKETLEGSKMDIDSNEQQYPEQIHKVIPYCPLWNFMLWFSNIRQAATRKISVM